MLAPKNTAANQVTRLLRDSLGCRTLRTLADEHRNQTHGYYCTGDNCHRHPPPEPRM
jgi:hypothetical protein